VADIAPTGFVRPELRELQPVVHGSVSAAELASFGLTLTDVIDFSVNTNPLGPAPSVLEAIRQTDWSRYPGDDELPLRTVLAGRAGVTADQVVLGNGSAELLWLIALAALRPGDAVAVVGPTFGEYARAARAVAAHVLEVQHLRDAGGCRCLFVCQPNNPTGVYHDQAAIIDALHDRPDRLLVLDEAYASFVDARWSSESLLSRYPNLVVLRSMTKDQAVPGLRLGYLLAAPELSAAVAAVRPPWNVNAGALRAGLAAMQPEAEAHLERGRAVVRASRTLLTRGLSELGYSVWRSAANFVLVDVGDAAAFRKKLLPHGLVVRDCTSFGLPSCVRIACRSAKECERLLSVVAEVTTRAG
jgi:histidinol-phosphate aminotransferase